MRTVECILEVNPERAIPCIKAIRDATGKGLKEAKDVYDASRSRGDLSGVLVRMSSQTYGELMLANALDAEWLFCFYQIKVVEESPPYLQL